MQRHSELPGLAHVRLTPFYAYPWPPTGFRDARIVQPAPGDAVLAASGWRETTIDVESLRVRLRLPQPKGQEPLLSLSLPARIESSRDQIWSLWASPERTAPPLGVPEGTAPQITLAWHADVASVTIWIWLIGGADLPAPYATYAELAVRGGPWLNCLVVGGSVPELAAAAYSLADQQLL